MIGALLAASIAAAPAWAQDARLEMDGVDYVVPAPAGYCAAGKAVDAYQAQGQQAPLSRAIVMFPCDADRPSVDAYLISADLDRDRTTRRAYLASLRASMADPVTSIREVLDTHMHHAFGEQATADGSLFPGDRDDVCGYILGMEELSIADEQIEAVMTACSTVIAGRLVYVIRYRRGSDFDAAVTAKRETRRIALSIVAASGATPTPPGPR